MHGGHVLHGKPRGFLCFLQFLRVKFVNSHGKKTAKKASILQQSRYNIQKQNNAALRAVCGKTEFVLERKVPYTMFQMKWVWKTWRAAESDMFSLCSTVLISMMALVNSVLTAQIMDTVFTPVQQGGSVTPALWSRLVFPRLAADRLHALPHLVPLSVDYYIRNVLAEAAFQAAP